MSFSSENLGSEVPETPPQTPATPQKKSTIWEHCRAPSPSRPTKFKGRGIFYCQPCWNRRISTIYRTSGGTRTTSDHLLSRHGITTIGRENKKEDETQKKLTDHASWAHHSSIRPRLRMASFPHFKAANLDSVILRGLWLDLITAKSLSLRLVESPELRALLHYVNPYANKLLPIAHSTIKMDLLADFNDKKVRIKQALREAISRIHFSFDGWTSPNQLGMIGVNVHFVHKSKRLCHLLLALQELDGSHTGENFADEVIALYDDFEITNSIGYMQGDNASTNDTAATWFDDKLEERGIEWTGNKYRMRCSGHIINLSVMAFLGALAKEPFDFEAAEFRREKEVNTAEIAENSTSISKTQSGKKKKVSLEYKDSAEYIRWRRLGPLGVLHNVVIYIHASPQRRQVWVKEYSGGLNLLRDNATRWNSWYMMLERALRLKEPLIRYIYEYQEQLGDTLGKTDWIFLESTKDFLEGFLDATKSTEGDNESLGGVLWSMDYLLRHYKQALSEHIDERSPLRRCLLAGLVKLENYFNLTDKSPAYAASVVLDPTWKWAYFEESWAHEPQWIENRKTAVKQLWIDDYKDRSTTYDYDYDATSRPSTSNSGEPPSKKQRSGFNEYRNRKRPSKLLDAVLEDEYERYCAEDLVELREGVSPLEWWMSESRRMEYPSLQRMAIEILSIPNMSASNERSFSLTKETVTANRGRMDASTIEMRECLRSWNASGLLSKVNCSSFTEISTN